jgi:hypothetical protein
VYSLFWIEKVEESINGMISTLATRIPEHQVTALAQISRSLNEKMKKMLETLPKQEN